MPPKPIIWDDTYKERKAHNIIKWLYHQKNESNMYH